MTYPAIRLRLVEREFPTDHLPFLRWLLFMGVTAFGFVLCWYYGLIHLMLASDKTYISAIIGILYIGILSLAQKRRSASGQSRGSPAAAMRREACGHKGVAFGNAPAFSCPRYFGSIELLLLDDPSHRR